MQGSSGKNPLRKRAEPRSANLKNYRIEIKLVGEPIYQFRVINVSTKGAGILIKDNSAFLDMIEVGQIVDVNFISPESSNPSGMYTAEIKHITKTYKNERQGQQLVGLSILKNLDQT
ncbi:MAG: PilZ domain-containing protein [Desulfobacterales bacterium]|nr:PilZ domain-containing protein [Desulfobacterales bacterium]